MEKANHIGTAEDFRKLAEAAAWAEPERVVLPKSGFAVIMRRPTKYYWALRRSGWPDELRSKIDLVGMGEDVQFSKSDLAFLGREDQAMLMEAFVKPGLSSHPKGEEIDPNWLPEEDAQFILKYLRGQVTADGHDLEAFRRRESKPAEGGGADGKAVRQDAGGDAPDAADGIPDQRSGDQAYVRGGERPS